MKDKKISTSRRNFLQGSLAAAPLSVAGSIGLLQLAGGLDTREAFAAPVSVSDAATPSSPYVPTYFNAEEWRFIEAACARLIPQDENGPGALEAGVSEFIDRQMETAYGHAGLWYMHAPFVADTPPEFGYHSKLTPREVYRLGIEAVNVACAKQYSGKKFAELSDADKDAVLTGLEKGAITSDDVPLGNFFAILLQNVKEGFLADPMHGGNKDMVSWKLIGFPGARADYADWVSQHGAVYPLPPVGITGKGG